MSLLFSAPFCAPANPSFTPLFRLLDEFDNYNQEAQGPQRNQQSVQRAVAFKPSFDVRETERTYELHGDLPGVERNDLHIEFTNAQTIVIRGRVDRTYETKPLSQEASNTKKSTNNHHVTVEDDPEDAASTSAPTPTETSKTEIAKPATAQAQKASVKHEKFWAYERTVGEFSRTFNFPTHVDQDGVTAALNNGVLNVTVPKAKKHQARRIVVN